MGHLVLMVIMKTAFSFFVLFLLFLGLPATPLLAQGQGLPAGACYTTKEMISDVTVNFMTFQGFHASRCDQLVEGIDKPTIKKYLSLHQEILAAHKPTFDEFTAELSVFLERNKIDGKQYLLSKALKFNEIFATPGVTRAGCTTLYGYMEKRRESWQEVIKPILGEMALRDEEYPKCNE
jgi:hypothetical protein